MAKKATPTTVRERVAAYLDGRARDALKGLFEDGVVTLAEEAAAKSVLVEIRLAIRDVGRQAPSYDPAYGDDRECVCGHPYHRHFDSYEEMSPVGCKYCECNLFKEKSTGLGAPDGPTADAADADEGAVTETYPVVDGLPLRLAFDPQAVREHFEDSPRVRVASAQVLGRVGAVALQNDGLYDAFHRSLCDAFINVTGFDPEEVADGGQDPGPTVGGPDSGADQGPAG